MKFDINHLFSAKYVKWVIISLIAFFLFLTIGEFLGLLFSFNKGQHPPVVVSHVQEGVKQELFDDLLSSSLFGTYVSNDLNDDNVKKSMLNVTLVGIMFAAPTNESQVIIRSAKGEENTYNVGDKIPGGALIKRITATGVLVERNGALESLSLPKNDLTFEPVAQPLIEE